MMPIIEIVSYQTTRTSNTEQQAHLEGFSKIKRLMVVTRLASSGSHWGTSHKQMQTPCTMWPTSLTPIEAPPVATLA